MLSPIMNMTPNLLPRVLIRKAGSAGMQNVIIALDMMSLGWNVKLSKGSRGPVDLYASKDVGTLVHTNKGEF